MLNLNILKSREDISPLLPVVYLFYLFSWWKDLLCLWSRWCVLLKESAKSYERLWYKFGKKSFVMEFNLPSAEPLSCIRADRTKIGQSSTNCIIAKWNNEWKNAVTGSLLRIISSVQFLGKHENSFGYIWFLYIVITYKTWS